MHFIPTTIHSADINECELETDLCSPNANCTDTDGSFNCTCREGFEGDGFNCTGIIIIIKHSTKQVHIYTKSVMCCMAAFNIPLQTFLSVKESWMIVTQMQLA